MRPATHLVVFLLFFLFLGVTVRLLPVVLGVRVVEAAELVQLCDLAAQAHLGGGDAHAVQVLVGDSVLGDERQVVACLDELGRVLPASQKVQPFFELRYCWVCVMVVLKSQCVKHKDINNLHTKKVWRTQLEVRL